MGSTQSLKNNCPNCGRQCSSSPVASNTCQRQLKTYNLSTHFVANFHKGLPKTHTNQQPIFQPIRCPTFPTVPQFQHLHHITKGVPKCH
ncbi:unnamed protein product [Cuscuta campestris]|uniref:Uncharacterized protein n=1 Tax=Cuscuta campestris TaxID=132261 RepID=A0A484KK28_9ASTE|nr:unnamed protein product [Cuscuta campestris]